MKIRIDDYFINEWIAAQQLYSEKDEENFETHWTDSYLIDLMLTKQFDELWQFVMKTYRKNLSQNTISILAAGPLEEILAMKGEEYIGRVELLAANDERFKYLLGGVWKNSMSDAVWERVCAIRGNAW